MALSEIAESRKHLSEAEEQARAMTVYSITRRIIEHAGFEYL